MRTVILFNLENGDAIYGNDNGEIRYVSDKWLEQEYFGKLSKDGPRVMMASDHANKVIIPISLDSFDRETIELNKYIVEAPDGECIVRCGYGPKANMWIIQGTVNKISQLPPQVE